MSIEDNNIKELKEIKTLFETAILPALIKMIEAIGEQSYESERRAKGIEEQLNEVKSSQPNIEGITEDFEKVTGQLNEIIQDGSANEEGFQILKQTINSFGDNFNELIETNNNLVQTQKKQTAFMEREGSANEEGFQILSNIITTLGSRVGDLIETNNNLVKSQRKQTERMEDIVSAFEENTARLNVLTLTMQNYMVEQAGKGNYADKEPVFSAIEEQVAKIREKESSASINNTKLLSKSSPIENPGPSVYDELDEKINNLSNRNKDKDKKD